MRTGILAAAALVAEMAGFVPNHNPRFRGDSRNEKPRSPETIRRRAANRRAKLSRRRNRRLSRGY